MANIYDNYKELACGIIRQEIDDYLHNSHYYRGLDRDDADFKLYEFCTTNIWFNYVDLDGEYLYVKVINMKKKGRKNTWHKKTNSENK